MKHIASVSFGKDSLAMLLRLLEENYPLDEVIFYNTGMEFEAIYNVRNKIVPILSKYNIGFTELNPERSFLYYMFEKPVKKRGVGQIHKYGYSWCGGGCRWGTSLKVGALEKHAKNCFEYVGLSFNERDRLQRKRNGKKVFPLNDWQMTGNDCLRYCHDRGYDWIENEISLYSILDHISCWCCRNKNLKELKNMYQFLPEYWEQLKELQSKTWLPMKGLNKSVFDLEKRFIREIEREKLEERHKQYTIFFENQGSTVTESFLL